MSSKPSPTGLPLCAVILSCFIKKRSTSGKLSPNAQMGFGQGGEKTQQVLSQVTDRGNHNVPVCQQCLVRVTLSYATHKVFVKVSKQSVVGMASKLTSKVAELSKTYWSPPRTKTLWSTKVVIYWYQ